MNTLYENSTGVYIGHRGWYCRLEHDDDGHLIIRATGYNTPWRSAEVEATCTACVRKVPNPECNCGIYALKDPRNLRAKLKGVGGGWIEYRFASEDQIQMLVFGSVLLWGDRIIEGDDGYRAHRARIETLVLPPKDIVPSHIRKDKTWTPVSIDLDKLAADLNASYGVPVVEDTELLYYWRMPEPILTTLTSSSSSGRRAGVPQVDTKTGIVYKSKSAVGRALAVELDLDPHDTYVWYAIDRMHPGRFKDATRADVDTYNKAHPLTPLSL